jgi:hypothetical protein
MRIAALQRLAGIGIAGGCVDRRLLEGAGNPSGLCSEQANGLAIQLHLFHDCAPSAAMAELLLLLKYYQSLF